MNIEDMQKINKLAKELLTHGFAATSDEAVPLAEKMLYGKQGYEQKKQEVVTERENQELRELQSIVRQMGAEFNRVNAELSSLKEAHEKLKFDFIQLRQRNFSGPAPAPGQSAQSHPQSTLSTAAAAEQRKNDAEQDRLSDEVAIDKVFYFGKK